MQHLKLTLLVVFAVIITGCAGTGSRQVEADYDFPELTNVERFFPSRSFSMSPMNDQVIMLSDTINTKYILVLARPDSAFKFHGGIGIVRRGNDIVAGQTRLYALDTAIKVGIPIRTIYKVDGKEELERVRQMVKDAKAKADAANERN
ncbi:hypothetical protein K0504_14970 [Neiella marina]|uniref:Uncharacterized protein n=1 Tax=Neiella holothuriorum TaxID=2870530 RepID=A0ABS7EKD4_9GAMM|nr:DUF6491 family protein [Neiella holothuriorum]MBW8192338.1 hypothetical protein [Neiella holothuriorum]